MEDDQPSLSTRRLKLNVTMGLYSLMAAFSVIWGVYTDRLVWFHPDPLFDVAWPVTASLGLGAGIALGLGISMLSVWMARRARWARTLMDEFRSLLGGLTSRDILLIAGLSSIGEELFFRGVLLPGLGHVLGSQWLGLAASSLVFGLLHVPSSRRMIPWMLQALFIGFVLGFLYLFTGDLTVCVATHLVINQRNLTIVQTWKGPLSRGDSPDRRD
jgi:membrane protease YdiL (CAAX protease family)